MTNSAKTKTETKAAPAQATTLEGWSRNIGISAVAAAVRYQGQMTMTRTPSQVSPPDRSTARGWSSARA